MKLLTKKETDTIYDEVTSFGSWKMTDEMFNEAVNKLLFDNEIVKKLLERVKEIKSKLD